MALERLNLKLPPEVLAQWRARAEEKIRDIAGPLDRAAGASEGGLGLVRELRSGDLPFSYLGELSSMPGMWNRTKNKIPRGCVAPF